MLSRQRGTARRQFRLTDHRRRHESVCPTDISLHHSTISLKSDSHLHSHNTSKHGKFVHSIVILEGDKVRNVQYHVIVIYMNCQHYLTPTFADHWASSVVEPPLFNWSSMYTAEMAIDKMNEWLVITNKKSICSQRRSVQEYWMLLQTIGN